MMLGVTGAALYKVTELRTNRKYFNTCRNQQVMIDRDLAELYGTETKVLNQAVKRNIERFPEDFMFQLSDEEFLVLRSQIVSGSKQCDTFCKTMLRIFSSSILSIRLLH